MLLMRVTFGKNLQKNLFGMHFNTQFLGSLPLIKCWHCTLCIIIAVVTNRSVEKSHKMCCPKQHIYMDGSMKTWNTKYMSLCGTRYFPWPLLAQKHKEFKLCSAPLHSQIHVTKWLKFRLLYSFEISNASHFRSPHFCTVPVLTSLV